MWVADTMQRHSHTQSYALVVEIINNAITNTSSMEQAGIKGSSLSSFDPDLTLKLEQTREIVFIASFFFTTFKHSIIRRPLGSALGSILLVVLGHQPLVIDIRTLIG